MNKIIVIAMLLMIPSAMALEKTQECLNSTHLESILMWDICEGSTCTVYNITQITNCTYGCNPSTNACHEPKEEEEFQIGVPLGLSGIAFVFAFLAVSAKKHGALQFLFLGICFGTVFVEIYVMIAFVSELGRISLENIISTGLNLYIYGFIIVIFYFVIVFLQRILTKTAGAGEGKEDGM